MMIALIHLKFVFNASRLAVSPLSEAQHNSMLAQQEQPPLLHWASSINDCNPVSLVRLLFIYLHRAASKPNTFNLAHLSLTLGQLGQLQLIRLFLQRSC